MRAAGAPDFSWRGELVARLNKDWTADAAAYDRIHAQILKMAGMLSAGIAAQFPEKVG